MNPRIRMLLLNNITRQTCSRSGFKLKLPGNRLLTTSASLPRKVDYYSVLGVNRNETEQNIKTAYFRLAKRYHPDYNDTPGSAPMFEMLSEAYEVLSNPDKVSSINYLRKIVTISTILTVFASPY